MFSFDIGEEWQLLTDEELFWGWEVYPTSLWNYGLRIDTDDPAAAVVIDAGTPGDAPFSLDDPLMELSVTGRLVQDWRLDSELSWLGCCPESGSVQRAARAGDADSLRLHEPSDNGVSPAGGAGRGGSECGPR